MAVQQDEVDKRRFPRMLCKSTLRYQIRGQSQFKDVVTGDLSLGGLSFSGGSFLPLNTPLNLEISLPYKTLKSEGKVVWSSSVPHSDNYHLGVEFSNVAQKDLELLDKFLNHQPLY